MKSVPVLFGAKRTFWAVLLLTGSGMPAPPESQAQGWAGYAGNAQHTAPAPAAANALEAIKWQTPVDLNPQFVENDLNIHYGSALITPENTVIVPVKTGIADGFQVEAHNGSTGAMVWNAPFVSDYTLAPHTYTNGHQGWTPSFGCTLTPANRLVIPGAGGTVYIRSNPDQPTGTVTQVAFYGLASYTANKAAYNSTVSISTPITSDSSGNLYFGFVVSGSNPLNLQSGLARISAANVGTYTAAANFSGTFPVSKIAANCAPALSNDGSKLYVAVNAAKYGDSHGFLLALNSQTLALIAKVPLYGVLYPTYGAYLADDGTSSPVVGPDGDVYFGVFDEYVYYNSPTDYYYSNNDRGWLLHFNADLSVQKIPGAFGWDDTPSIVPASAVPSYTGTSAYLLLTKYNNYISAGGNGINRVAILDPNAMMTDPITGSLVMSEVITVTGVTPDTEFPDVPGAVREWCINSAAVDTHTKSALINSEDGKLYRWDFTTNTLAQTVTLTPGVGEAYTPTLVGPDGTVYAINNATLFAVSGAKSVTASGTVTLEGFAGTAPQNLHFEFRAADPQYSFTRTIAVKSGGTFTLPGIPARSYTVHVKGGRWLAKNIAAELTGGDVSGLSVTLVGGDADNSNGDDFDDFLILLNAFGSSISNAGSGYDPSADFDGSGTVDFDDFLILLDNFGSKGDS